MVGTLTMKRRSFLFTLLLLPAVGWAETRVSPAELFTAAVENVAQIYAPAPGTDGRTFSTTLQVVKAPMKELAGRSAKLSYHAPDRLLLSAEVGDQRYAVGRHGDEIWFHVPGKNWGVVGRPDVPKFSNDPASVDRAPVPHFTFPQKAKLALLPTLCTFEEMPAETVLGVACRVIVARPRRPRRRACAFPRWISSWRSRQRES